MHDLNHNIVQGAFIKQLVTQSKQLGLCITEVVSWQLGMAMQKSEETGGEGPIHTVITYLLNLTPYIFILYQRCQQ